MRNVRFLTGIVIAAAAMAASAADKWTYTHYTASGFSLGTGTLELVEEDGKATISMLTDSLLSH